ncbi:MBL fold metallo-hydrolase, partial [Odoribacter sp. N15.MGS-14]|uniref:MBL fold metallo-hydrolase n=1 Tax=Odoribacter sp. N15.MGS-14 TaxID=1637502 RepID=UPI0006235B6E
MHSVELKLLPVSNGDSIHLRFSDQDGIMRNILIDGGPAKAYEYLNSKKKKEEGALKELINFIRAKNEQIDLLILTHIDDDHIGGILRWFEDSLNLNDLVKEVWFNSGLI